MQPRRRLSACLNIVCIYRSFIIMYEFSDSVDKGCDSKCVCVLLCLLHSEDQEEIPQGCRRRASKLAKLNVT